MNATFISVVISMISLFITLIVAIFLMGTRWAKLSAKLDLVLWRVERIEALFGLTIKKPNQQ